MEVAFARPGQVPQPNVRMVALVVAMIVFSSSALSCLAAESPEVPEHAYITYGAVSYTHLTLPTIYAV